MTAPMRLRLDQATRTAVSERYEHARKAVERTNCQMVLLADEGRHATEIAWLVRRGPDQVRTVLHRFQSEGLAGLAPRKHTGRAIQVTPIAPIARVLTASREAGLSVVYLTMNLGSGRRPDPGGGAGYWTQERWTRWIAAGEPKQTVDPDCRLPAGVRESDIIPELMPAPGDVTVLKPRWTGFYNTELDAILKERGITTLVFTGGTTSNCLEATSRDAFFRDYRCLLLADCTWEPVGNRLSRSNYEATLLLVELQYGWVSDSSALIRALSQQRTVVNAAPAV